MKRLNLIGSCMEKGKYYITPAGDPFFNMAFDEWLFGRLQSGGSGVSAYLRLYSWGKEAITIGYNQNPDKAVNFEKLDRRLPIIRRITGGRAIYHDVSELTMTLMMNISVLPQALRSLKETNRRVSEAIVDIFNMVGLEADWARQSSHRFMNSQKDTPKACFDSMARFEILSGNRKIAAGAQRRIGDCLIHQGSLKVNGVTDCPAISQLAPIVSGKPPVEKNEDVNYNISDFSEIFPEIFSGKLNLKFETNCLTIAEMEDIDKFTAIFMEKVLDRR